MLDSYHYARNGQTAGPVPLARIREMVVAGELARTDYVIPAGGKEWLTADKVLGAAAPGAAPAVPAARAASTPAKAAARTEGFRYRQDGQDHGPVGFDELKRLATAGKLRPNDLVSEDGGGWKPAARFRGVFIGRRCEVNGVSFLHPKDWWVNVKTNEDNPEIVVITVENKFVAMTLSVYPGTITPDKALRTLRGTIEDNERFKNPRFSKGSGLLGGEKAEGFEYEATMMSMLFVGRVYAAAVGDRTVTFMVQASEERFDSIRPAADLIRGSLAVVG